MKKRTVGVLAGVLFAFSGIMAKLYQLNNQMYSTAVETQSTVTVTVAQARGTLYDSQLQPLTNSSTHYAAAVTATPQALTALTDFLSTQEMESLQQQLQSGKPVILTSEKPFPLATGIQQFIVPTRYTEAQLAAHIVGYVGSDGVHGACGAELAFDEELAAACGAVTITYQADAHGKADNSDVQVENTLYRSRAGVALTIDSRLQQMVENIAGEAISKGAVVILEPSTGNILAMASFPTFSPTRLSEYLEQETAPLFNRAMAAYNCGSVFKTVTAMAALESGIPLSRSFTCSGVLPVGSNRIKCHHVLGHGYLDMNSGYAQSCNPYFIQLAQEMGSEPLYRFASLLGFDSPLLLATGLSTVRAEFPTPSELSQPTQLANVSFGQGDLMATPLHIAQMTACVVNGGVIYRPNLYAGQVDAWGKLTPHVTEPATPICSQKTAAALKSLMEAVVTEGSGKAAMPTVGGAGGKTGTAETGWVGQDGETMVQNWFTGFYPAQTPQYVITVLTEDSNRTGESAAPVFAALCNHMYRMGYLEQEP